MSLSLNCRDDTVEINGDEAEKLFPHLPLPPLTTLETLRDERITLPFESTILRIIVVLLKDCERQVPLDSLRDLIEAIDFLDSMELFNICFGIIQRELRDDRSTDSDLLARLSPLPGDSGHELLDCAIQQCDERAYSFLTVPGKDVDALIVPVPSQMTKWISVTAKLAPWREHCRWDRVEKIGWFGKSDHVYTLVVPRDWDRMSPTPHATLCAWDLSRRSAVFELPQLYDAEIGPFDFIYTLDGNYVLKAWNIATAGTNVEGMTLVTGCKFLTASSENLFVDPGFEPYWDDEESLDEGTNAAEEASLHREARLNRISRAKLWSMMSVADGTTYLSPIKFDLNMRSFPRFECDAVVRFSTDGSFIITLYNLEDLIPFVYLNNITDGLLGTGGRLKFRRMRDDDYMWETSHRVFDLRISPDNTYIAILWKGRVMIRSVPNRQAREEGRRKAASHWTDHIDQAYEVPTQLHDKDDQMAGLAISPDSRRVAIVTWLGRLMLLQREGNFFQTLLATQGLSWLHRSEKTYSSRLSMTHTNEHASLSWSPNGKLLAVGHNKGFDVLVIDEILHESSCASTPR